MDSTRQGDLSARMLNSARGVIASPRTVPRDNAELQKLLIDERMRCETHKTNYQTLKEEHKRLQDEHIKVQEELTKSQRMGTVSSDQKDDLIQTMRNQLHLKTKELEEVRGQTMHPAKLEVLKAEISKDLEEPIRVHMIAMDKEVEKYRTEYNKLRYDQTFLQTEFEHAKSEHARAIEEQKLRFQAQLTAVQYERDQLLKTQQKNPSVEQERILQLQRLKTQLEQRVQNLSDEAAEQRKLKELSDMESDAVQRSQAKDIAHLQTNLKSVESDKRSADMQCERVKKELQDAYDRINSISQQLQDVSKECSSVRSQADEQAHKHKVEISNHKMEFLKVQGDLQREKDSLLNKTHALEADLEIVRGVCSQHEKEMERMENETSARIQEALEVEWSKSNSLQNDKMQLEERCKELEQRYQEERSCRQEDRERNEEDGKSREENVRSLQHEISLLKSKLEQETRARQANDQDRLDCANLRQRVHELEKEVQQVAVAKQQAVEEVKRTHQQAGQSRDEMEQLRMRVQRAQMDSDKLLEENKMSWMEEKHRLQSRIDQLEFQAKKNEENREKNSKRHQKLKKAFVNKLRKLKSDVELLEAQKEQLEIDMKAGRHGVSMEDHNRVKRRMRELKRRHDEFSHVMQYDENLPPPTVRDIISPVNQSACQVLSARNAERQQKEIERIRRRMDDFAAVQERQMAALDQVTKLPLAGLVTPRPEDSAAVTSRPDSLTPAVTSRPASVTPASTPRRNDDDLSLSSHSSVSG